MYACMFMCVCVKIFNVMTAWIWFCIVMQEILNALPIWVNQLKKNMSTGDISAVTLSQNIPVILLQMESGIKSNQKLENSWNQNWIGSLAYNWDELFLILYISTYVIIVKILSIEIIQATSVFFSKNKFSLIFESKYIKIKDLYSNSSSTTYKIHVTSPWACYLIFLDFSIHMYKKTKIIFTISLFIHRK